MILRRRGNLLVLDRPKSAAVDDRLTIPVERGERISQIERHRHGFSDVGHREFDPVKTIDLPSDTRPPAVKEVFDRSLFELEFPKRAVDRGTVCPLSAG